MRLIFLLLLVVSVGIAGCTTASRNPIVLEKAKFELENDYKKVVYFNGINKFEAEAIAYHYLLNSGYKSYYDVFSPEIRKDKEARRYKDYWFVHFSPDAHHDANSFLVVIDKKNGDIITAQNYVPHTQIDLNWVFEKRNAGFLPAPLE